MKRGEMLASIWMLLGSLVALTSCIAVLSNKVEAQTGDNAVYNASGNCNSTSQCAQSAAFIDASVSSGAGTNICGILHGILSATTFPSTGAVIDARGLNSGNTSMTCTASPWAGITSPLPSTILLPATQGNPIVVSASWVLPNNTKLIGESGNVVTGSSGSGTTIQASSSFPTPGSMIQFGSSSLCGSSGCNGISVENLTLDGQGYAVNGIMNQYAQDLSYADHVNLYRITGIGLIVSTSASNSGPYSNITFDTGGTGISSTTCAQINGLSATHGIHGLACIAETSDSTAAIYLDSSNNTIEDVRIVGFYDGIRIGSQGNAQSNVLLNILGDTNKVSLSPINVVHISSSSYTVSDLSIMGVANQGSGVVSTILDDLTSTDLTDGYVGMYALGKALKNGSTLVGYSRFTTSPNAATWAAGTTTATGNCNAQTAGSLYSNNTAGASPALYVCPIGGGTWKSVK